MSEQSAPVALTPADRETLAALRAGCAPNPTALAVYLGISTGSSSKRLRSLRLKGVREAGQAARRGPTVRTSPVDGVRSAAAAARERIEQLRREIVELEQEAAALDAAAAVYDERRSNGATS